MGHDLINWYIFKHTYMLMGVSGIRSNLKTVSSLYTSKIKWFQMWPLTSILSPQRNLCGERRFLFCLRGIKQLGQDLPKILLKLLYERNFSCSPSPTLYPQPQKNFPSPACCASGGGIQGKGFPLEILENSI